MKTKDLTIIALMSALAVVLSPLKINGTIGLDSIPAFLIFFIYRDDKAAYVAGLAHFLNALVLGFPFSLPVHLMITLGMFIMMILAKLILMRTNLYVSMLFIFVFNALLLPIMITLFFNVASLQVLIVLLAPTVLLNLIIAYLIYLLLKRT